MDKVLSCFAEVLLVGVWMKTTKSCRFERPQAFDYPVSAYEIFNNLHYNFRISLILGSQNQNVTAIFEKF